MATVELVFQFLLNLFFNSLLCLCLNNLQSKIRILEVEKDVVGASEVDFMARKDDAVIRVSCALDDHPVSRVIKMFREHQMVMQDTNVSTTEDGKVIHTFSFQSWWCRRETAEGEAGCRLLRLNSSRSAGGETCM
ncbi:hypothetical protein L6452_38145 [Arctium lappa]|uniref:Uncharacterized protein n=1 Tax=Arctium lappa TaxID=4217 RepID=A0ACB8Y5J8_ARCLA|nr:hypothetical protein L6452_38145 [Arctium lappa]